MQCPNCHNEVPDTANNCGHCGTVLRSKPKKSGLSGLVWGFLAVVIGLGLLLLIGVAGYIFFFRQPTPGAPQPAQVVTLIVEQTQTPPEPTEEPPQPTSPPVPTAPPTPLPAPVEETDYCEVFDSVDMSVVFLKWNSGAPLTFYVKMPGGVPTLEKEISGVSEQWRYSVTIEDYETESCDFIQGYKDHLYCSMDLPEGYASSIRSLSIGVSSCDRSIYNEPTTYMPDIERANANQSSCGIAPSGGPDGCTTEYRKWCSCMKGSFICSAGGPICIIP